MAKQGEIIDSKYEILREVGRGGMSVVYLAMDRRLNKQWAIKQFKKNEHDYENKIHLKALLAEAHLMKKLDHPTLPRIVDIIEEQDNVYIVMDYIEGESINKVLEASGAQPQEAVIEWAKDLADVMFYLHSQNPPVIYRDMKPSNIMLKPDGTIRLIDFGIAREYKQGKDGDTESLGTKGYAAPEQLSKQGQTDARTDIYSFGVTLYHIVTGKNPAEPPYEIYPIRHWNPKLSSGLEWLIEKCTQLNPGDRFQSFAEIIYVLDNISKFDTTYKRKRKSKINIFITTLLMSIFCGVLSIGLFMGNNAQISKRYAEQISKGTIAGYEEAIKIDNDNPEAYVKLAEYLSNSNISFIYPGQKSDNEKEGMISESEIMNYFTLENNENNGQTEDKDKKKNTSENGKANFESIKSVSPEKYAKSNYCIGMAYWQHYEPGKWNSNGEYEKSYADDTAGTNTDAGLKAMPYFANAINAAKNSSDGLCGLEERELNRIKSYYLVIYFTTNEQLRTGDFDRFTVSDIVADILRDMNFEIGEDKKLSDPYLAFWNINMYILNFYNESTADGSSKNDINDKAKIETLKILAYMIQERHKVFHSETDKITSEEMSNFFSSYNNAVDKIASYEDRVALANEINKTIPSVNGLYKTSIPYVEVKQ